MKPNTSEKLKALEKYLTEVKTKLSSVVPEKHKDRVTEYKSYLTSEVKRTERTINQLKV